MRIVVNDIEYPSLKVASIKLGISIKALKKSKAVDRVYYKGYWEEVEKDTLKAIGRAKRGGYMFIED